MLGASRWPRHSLLSHRAQPGQLGAAAGRGPGSLPAHRHHHPLLCLQPPSDFQPCTPADTLTFLSQRWHFQLMLIFLPLQVFLSTSKAAGIKLALFSITQHQRHLTDAEEQRFGLDVGRKLSNASSTETWEEASGERLDPPPGAARPQPGSLHLQPRAAVPCRSSPTLSEGKKASGAAGGLWLQRQHCCPITCCTSPGHPQQSAFADPLVPVPKQDTLWHPGHQLLLPVMKGRARM